MKLHLRWQILLAVLGLLLALSILSFQGHTAVLSFSADLCTTRVPAEGGVFTEGVVGAPQYLNPLLSDANPVGRELVSLLFDGLTQVGADGRIQPALAESWTVSEDGRTLQFTLREDAVWHDGEPVTAADALFTYGLMQQEDFPGSPALKVLWQSVSIKAMDDRTVEFVLAEPYAPFLEATTRGLLPEHILADVTAAELLTHPFNQSPVGTGPWQVAADQNWTETGSLRLTPNLLVWREGTAIPTIEFRFYPDEASLITALKNGDITAVSHITPAMLPDAAAQPDIRLFTAAAPRYTELLFNLTEDSIVSTLEVRQALAYALDRQALVDTLLAGQGIVFEGPYLPSSWAYNPAQLTAYQTDPVTATARLDAAGWTLSEGQTVRQNGETPLHIRLLTLDSEPYLSLAQAIQEQWTAVNVSTTISATTNLRESLASGQFDVALFDIAPTADPDLYDFWSQEALVRGQNYAQWNNRRASESLESARQLWSEAERRPYYDTFLRLFDSSLPALTLYQHTNTYALSQNVNAADIGYLYSPRDRYASFANWFLLYRDVPISCPATPAS
jgi:peptide/nickel transport system substrate-binding protein